MAGTKLGGQRAAKTVKHRYGNDFYAKIGAKGGKNSAHGGFAANPEKAPAAGHKGGIRSKRGHKLIRVVGNKYIYLHVKSGEQVIYYEDDDGLLYKEGDR